MTKYTKYDIDVLRLYLFHMIQAMSQKPSYSYSWQLTDATDNNIEPLINRKRHVFTYEHQTGDIPC